MKEKEEEARKEAEIPAAEAAAEQEAAAESAAEGEAVAEQEAAAEDVAEEKAEQEPEEKREEPAQPDWKDRYARAMADFDNFRKRVERDRDELAKFATAGVIKDLLPTADNLELALKKAEDPEDPFVKGVKMAYDVFLKVLESHGAVPIDSMGEPFDANFHEALAQMPSPDVEEGRVMNEIKRGWLLNGRLLRAAQVVVSAGKPEA